MLVEFCSHSNCKIAYIITHNKYYAQPVDSLGRHGLSCKRSEGRHSRHSAQSQFSILLSPELSPQPLPALNHRACQDQMVNGQMGLQSSLGPKGNRLSGMPPALTLLPAHTLVCLPNLLEKLPLELKP